MRTQSGDRRSTQDSILPVAGSDPDSSLKRQFWLYCGGRYKLVIPWALLLSAAMWEVGTHGRILAWGISLALSQVSVQVLCGLLKRASSVDKVGTYWKRGLILSACIDSLVVGSAGIYLFPAGSMPHQSVLALFLCCMGAVAVVTFFAYLPAGIASVLLVMVPLTGTFLYQGSGFSLTMAGVLVLVAAALVGASVRLNRLLLESRTLRLEKEELIESLSEENEKMQDLRKDLEAEALERQLIVDSLRRSEDRYRAVVEGQTEMVCRLLKDGRLSFVNESCCRYSGLASADLLGRNFLEFVHPEDVEAVRHFLETLGAGPVSKTHEHRVHTSAGEARWLQWTFQAIYDSFGEIIEMQGVGRDVTARRTAEEALQRSHEELEQRVQKRTAELQEMNKRLQLEIADRIRAEKSLRDSEQRFRTIFEKAKDCIFVKDKDLRYSHLNPAMQGILEAEEPDIVGCTDDDLYGSERAKGLKSEDVRVLRGQTIEAEHTLIVKGRELTFNCVKVPMIDSYGDIIGLCGIARDVTERLATQTRLVRNNLEFASRSMRGTLEQIRLAAASDSLVLLLGESGSGKDYLARHLHQLSRRAGGPFFAINCAALPAELAESELFGHEAGSFTGARARKRGMMELAEGGTLLLNEIGELSMSLQAKLLTFLDTRSFTRVGGEVNVEVNARLIAATNRELWKEVDAGRFRHDLYHRLNVFPIHVPPLRKRLEDLPLLVDTILGELCAKLGHAEALHVDARCLPILAEYKWPGNVRELRNVLERAMILSGGRKVTPEEIRLAESQTVPLEHEGWSYVVRFPTGAENLNDISKGVRSELIKEALRRTSGVKKDAAELLGVSVEAFRYQARSLGE